MPPLDITHQKAHECPFPHATSALPGHSAPSRLVEEPSNPRASMLPQKNVPVANVAAHPKGSPMPLARSFPSKGTQMPLPSCNECPPHALGPVSARRGTLKPSSEHVASEKHASGQSLDSPRGTHPCLLPDIAHQKAHRCPFPNATSALLGRLMGLSDRPRATHRKHLFRS